MLYDSPILTIYVLGVTCVLGLVMGSFINCWAWRSTHGESVMKGRSHCPACGHALGVRDLVPVFSWLFSKGKCRYCGEKVSARYPATELICAAVFVAIVAKYGLTVETVELLAFSGVLLFLSLTDLDDYIIPNGCIIVALAIRIAYMVYAYVAGIMDLNAIGYYVLSAVGVGVILVVITLVADKAFGRESMGGGDLKLYFVAGLYFGWQQGIFLIVVSCVIGIVVAMVGLRASASDAAAEKDAASAGKKAEGEKGAKGQEADAQSSNALKRVIPFGPSIAVACVITMLAGEQFVTWYMALL